VTALSICLGGDLASLNRQSDLASLVNTEGNADTAVVEVELFKGKGQTTVVRAEIRSRGGGLTWTVDKARVSKRELLELADSLQIQPGNLCQFLPQDVVRDFPTMNPQEIFCNTVKAVGDTGLLDSYNRLKQLQGEVETLEEQTETKQNTLTSLEKKSNKLEGDKAIYNQRKEVERKKTEIENCIKWKTFSDLRKAVKDTRDKERTIMAKKTKLVEKRSPLKEFLSEYERKVALLRQRLEVADREYNLACGRVEDYDTSELEDQLDRLVEQERDLTQQEQDRVSQRARIEAEVVELAAQVAALQADTRWVGLEAQISEQMGRRAKLENSLQRSEQTLAEFAGHHQQLGREVAGLEQQARNLQNKKERKLKTLEKENLEAYQGVVWLRDNRGLFNKPVHDPIMLTLDVKNNDFARYVEFHIGRADLEGFVCEDAGDMNRLLTELRENQKLRRINVFHSSPDPPESFRHPFSRDQMEQFAFVEYLSDMYDAPDAVNAYLCRQKNLHSVPVFSEENSNSGQLKQKFNNYYIGMQKFNVRKSKYSGELSTGTDDIGGKRVIRLAGAVDREEMERVEAELATKRRLVETNVARQANMAKTCEGVRAKIAELNDAILALRTLKKDHVSKQSELAMKRRTLEQLARPAADVPAERRRIGAERRAAVVELSGRMREMQRLAAASIGREEERRLLHLALQNLESENSEGRERLAAVERDLEGVAAEHAAVQARCVGCSLHCTVLHCTGQVGPGQAGAAGEAQRVQEGHRHPQRRGEVQAAGGLAGEVRPARLQRHQRAWRHAGRAGRRAQPHPQHPRQGHRGH
jgi:chromosome segregation ATPase